MQSNKAVQKKNAALMAENVSLRQAILNKSCFSCGGLTEPADLHSEHQRLLMENARLRDEIMRAKALLHQMLHPAPPAERRPPPPVVPHRRPAAVLSAASEGGSVRADRAAPLRAHAEAAMGQFLQLATKGEPLWLPTPDGDGEALSYLGYRKKELPLHHHGFGPNGFVMEATRETGMVRATAADIVVAMLTNAVRAHVHASSPIHSIPTAIAMLHVCIFLFD